MKKLKQEIGTVDIVIWSVVFIAALVFKAWLIPAVLLYYISRKVDSKSFKIGSYIAVSLLVVSGIFWSYSGYSMYVLQSLLYLLLGNSYNMYNIYIVLQFGLPFLAYSIVFITYWLYPRRNRYIVIAFLIVVMGPLFVLSGYIFTRLIPDAFEYGQIPQWVYYFSNLRPYLITLVLVSLYKNLFIDDNVEEIYEETI